MVVSLKFQVMAQSNVGGVRAAIAAARAPRAARLSVLVMSAGALELEISRLRI